MASGGVLVAVRCRPFLPVESAEDSAQVVTMIEDTTHVAVKNSNGVDDERKFQQFKAHWSVFPGGNDYVNQVQVFEGIGQQAVDAILSGYNVCVFAYGQVASGKTYTTFGTPDDPGVFPRICQALLTQVTASNSNFSMDVSFLDLYNEKVFDLLDQSGKSDSSKLRVREHPQTGPFVEGLSWHKVRTADDVMFMMQRGLALRHTGETSLHADAHRGHGIFSIVFKQFTAEHGVLTERTSRINLVDMAGVERLSTQGSVTDLRVKEGGNTNKSLTVFGQCLNGLAERARSASDAKSAKAKPRTGKAHVPYRDSNLTFLLKESLGGNSKTFMIATISPAAMNRKETLATLHYADRAKKIINRAVVNEDRNSEVVKELKTEISRLERALERAKTKAAKEAGKPILTDAEVQTDEIEEDTGPSEAMQQLQTQLEEVTSERNALLSRIAELEALVVELEAKIAGLEATEEQLKANEGDAHSQLRGQLEQAQAAKQQLEEQHAAAMDSLKEDHAQQLAELTGRLEQAVAEKAELESQYYTTAAELAATTTQAKDTLQRHDKLLADLKQQHERERDAALAELQAKLEGLTVELDEVKNTQSSQDQVNANESALLESMKKQHRDDMIMLESRLRAEVKQAEARTKAAQEQAAQAGEKAQEDDEGWREKYFALEVEMAEMKQFNHQLKSKLKIERDYFKRKILNSWEPNKPTCTNCELPFNLRNRRHHCRLCGQVFCASCCAERVQTTASKKPARACHECYRFVQSLDQDITRDLMAPLPGQEQVAYEP
eukprot:TRINITY_DN7720_c0_g1_i1.p1 TRINITY_DN7720_c0_g1~~TRINITY_DN7720_c0_g1_i1.p1  ORF type:complete len:788 (+),score=209.67 TRINITY_DN7720_c0_g1_i1:26-2365(+)